MIRKKCRYKRHAAHPVAAAYFIGFLKGMSEIKCLDYHMNSAHLLFPAWPGGTCPGLSGLAGPCSPSDSDLAQIGKECFWCSCALAPPIAKLQSKAWLEPVSLDTQFQLSSNATTMYSEGIKLICSAVLNCFLIDQHEPA